MNKKIFTVILSSTLCLSMVLCCSSTYAYKGTKIMKKYLIAHKQKNYKQLKKYLSKMPKYSEDTSLKKISKTNKKAYIKKIKSFKKKYKPYPIYYYLADMNKDRRPELILRYDPAASAGEAFVYTYKSKKVKYIGKFNTAQSLICTYPGKGIVRAYGHMGVSINDVYYIKKGELKKKHYGTIDSPYTYYAKMAMSGHCKYNKGKYTLNYSPLK